MKINKRHSGFTLAELLVALMITSLILGAVAAIAYAMGSANDNAEISGTAQAQVRFTSNWINEKIKFSRMIFDIPGEGIAVWVNDNGFDGFGEGDDKVNPGELTILRFNENNLEYKEYSPKFASESWFAQKEFTVSEIQSGIAQTFLDSQCVETPPITVVSDTSNGRFVLDTFAPYTRQVTIEFEIEENGVSKPHKINTAVLGWAGHLLNASGEIVSSDDDT